MEYTFLRWHRHRLHRSLLSPSAYVSALSRSLSASSRRLSCRLVLGENCLVAFPCQIFGRLPWGSPDSPPLSPASFLLFFLSFFFLFLARELARESGSATHHFLLVSPDPRTHPPRRSVGSSARTARVQFRPGGGRIRPWVSARSDTEKQFRLGDGRNRHWVSAQSDTSKPFRSGGGRICHWMSARSDTENLFRPGGSRIRHWVSARSDT